MTRTKTETKIKKRQKGGDEARKSPWTCESCSEAILVDDGSIECYGCKEWVHRVCTGLTKTQYATCREGGNFIQWLCEGCRGEGDGKEDKVRSRLEAKLDKMMDMMTNVQERVERLEGGYLRENIDDLIQKAVEAKVSEYFEEAQERDRRKNFVVISNVPESKSTLPEDRRAEDLAAIKTILNKVSENGEGGVLEHPVRLGKIQMGKEARPRLLRVKLQKAEQVDSIMKNVGKMRDTVNAGVNDPKKRIYINRDRTPKERDQFRKLQGDLKKRQQEGETDLMIRGDKIVKKGERMNADKASDEGKKGGGAGRDEKTERKEGGGGRGGNDFRERIASTGSQGRGGEDKHR